MSTDSDVTEAHPRFPFFVPGAPDEQVGEILYGGMRKNVELQTEAEVSAARIRKINYNHDGIDCVAEVGQESHRGLGTIMGIFHIPASGMYFVASSERGMWAADALEVGKDEMQAVLEFDL